MRRFIICLVLAALICLLMICLSPFYLLDLLFNLAAGWMFYCSRVLPQVRPSAAGILTAFICLAGLGCGTHLFLRWLTAQVQATQQAEGESTRPWPARRTVALVALTVLMFVAGIAAVGVTHQTAWLVNSPESIIKDTRGSLARTQLRHNLKQMALAMAMYSDEKGSLPPAASQDRDGRPLLSWRVLILPYVNQEKLYKEFQLEEPWDSLWNLRLLPQMPFIYAPLSDTYTATGYRTHWQVFTGEGTAFDGKCGLSLKKDFPNGLANTLLIVESARAVPWTKPEDLPYTASRPLPPLGNFSQDYFLSALADGGVLSVERTESEQAIRALITRNGAENERPKQ